MPQAMRHYLPVFYFRRYADKRVPLCVISRDRHHVNYRVMVGEMAGREFQVSRYWFDHVTVTPTVPA